MTFLRMPDGTMVHVRMAKRPRRRCTVCDGLTPEMNLRECDYVLEGGKTCDRLMCSKCARRVGPNVDLCPQHHDLTVTPTPPAPVRSEADWAEIDDLFDRTDWEPRR